MAVNQSWFTAICFTLVNIMIGNLKIKFLLLWLKGIIGIACNIIVILLFKRFHRNSGILYNCVRNFSVNLKGT